MALQLAGADRGLGAQAGQLGEQIVGGQRGQSPAGRIKRRFLGRELPGQVGEGGRQFGLAGIQRRQILRQPAAALVVPSLRLPGAFSGQLHPALLGREPALRRSDLIALGAQGVQHRPGRKLVPPRVSHPGLMPLHLGSDRLNLRRQLAQRPGPRKQAAVLRLALAAAGDAAARPHDFPIQRDHGRTGRPPQQPSRGGQILHHQRMIQRQLDRGPDGRIELHQLAGQAQHAGRPGHIDRAAGAQTVKRQESRPPCLALFEELDRVLRILPTAHHDVLQPAAQRGLDGPLQLRRHVEQVAQRADDAL